MGFPFSERLSLVLVLGLGAGGWWGGAGGSIGETRTGTTSVYTLYSTRLLNYHLNDRVMGRAQLPYCLGLGGQEREGGEGACPRPMRTKYQVQI